MDANALDALARKMMKNKPATYIPALTDGELAELFPQVPILDAREAQKHIVDRKLDSLEAFTKRVNQ